LPYPLPTLEEQNEIAEYIDKKLEELNTIISQKQGLLAELQAYKKSVIYEYVTGKKEV
jgi:type I restriction enzyme S subunit